MRKNRKYDWPKLIEEFEASGKTQVQYCKENAIHPRYFSQKRSEYLNKKASSNFTKVEVKSSRSVDAIQLEVGRCRIYLPPSIPLSQLQALVEQFA